MKKILSLVISLLLVFVIVGCGNEKDPNKGDDTSTTTWAEAKNSLIKITIYVDESNVYGPYVKGSDENYVKEEIQKKFWEDTGIGIDLDIKYESHATFSNSFSGVMATGSWDAAVSYIGQAGLEETILNQNVTLDISDTLKKNGPKILSTLDTDSWNAVTNYSEETIGIPSVNLTKQKGVLVRKDFMTRVGYTESREEAENSNGSLIWCGTIKDFDTMVRKMKREIPTISAPLSGSVYDMEFTLLAGALDSTGYQYRSVEYNGDGSVKEVLPGWISKNYGKVLQQEYDWVSNGIWEADNMTMTNQTRISNLASGKSAVFFADPTVTNLIDVARKCKEIDSSAEFVLLDPLEAVDTNGNAIEGSGAFVEVSRNTDCLIFNKRSKKVDLIIKYMNWMYSSKENYELCAYGIKGEQWKESSYGDDYYEYADEYYVTHKPYSGVFALIHNDEISYKVPMQYTEIERDWISKVRNYKCLKNETDGMLFYGMNAQVSTNFITAEADMYLDCATKAWAGSANPSNTWSAAVQKYRDQAGDYITWLTNQYKLYKAARSAA